MVESQANRILLSDKIAVALQGLVDAAGDPLNLDQPWSTIQRLCYHSNCQQPQTSAARGCSYTSSVSVLQFGFFLFMFECLEKSLHR